MGVRATAKHFVEVNSPEELLEVVKYAKSIDLQFMVLGGGSNLLFVDDFDGLIIKNQILGIDIIEESDSEVVLKIGAGENWHSLVEKCVKEEWYGIENLALIPGTVGAAPIQNIGAYGVELVEVFESLEALDIEKEEQKTFSKNDCHFGYRDSVFKGELKNKVVITNVRLKLSKVSKINTSYVALKDNLDRKGISQPTIKDVFNSVVEVRKSKLPDPDVIGNNGSFFKNPVIPVFHFDELKQQYPEMPSYPVTEHLVKIPAGWLIDKAGWKGFRSGDAGVHEKQALVLVNYGNASGRDIYELSEKIKQDIVRKFEISLVKEVNLVMD